jgi:hypothetical protein
MAADTTSLLLAGGIAACPIVAVLEIFLISTPIQVTRMFIISVAPNIRTLVHLLAPFVIY